MGRANKSVYRCTGCGWESAKWLGRCGGCNAWNTLTEESAGGDDKRTFRIPTEEKKGAAPVALDALDGGDILRHATGIGELDRVLGGGLVPGALILVGGDPGIGKSTLLLFALDSATKRAKRPALYVTGE